MAISRPVIGGVVAGVVSSLAVNLLSPRREAQSRQTVPVQPANPAAPIRETLIRHQVVVVNAQPTTQDAGPTSNTRSDAGPPTQPMIPSVPPSAVEIAEREQLASDERLAQHQREPIDPSWSPSSSRAFTDDLRGTAFRDRLTVVNVSCRSRSCLATLEWG